MALKKIYTIEVQGWQALLTNAEEARAALAALTTKAEDLRAELAKTPTDAPEFAALEAQQRNIEEAIEQTTKALEGLQESLQNSAVESQDLRKQLKDLQQVKLPTLEVGSEEFREAILQIQKLEAALDSTALAQQAVTAGFIGINDAANTLKGLERALAAVNIKKTFTEGEEELAKLDDDLAAITAQMTELALANARAARTQGELKAALEDLEGIVIPNLDIGSEEFRIANTEAQRLDQQLEALRKTGEAAAKGFVAVGSALNTLEGVAVQITALEAGLAFAATDEERQAIQRDILLLEDQRVGLEGVARAATFAEGSIGRMEAELQQATEQLRRLPAGSEEFDQVAGKVAEIEQNIKLAQLAAESGFFPEGSIGQLEAELQGLQAQLRRLPEGSAEFNEVTKAIDATERQLESLQLTAQKNIFPPGSIGKLEAELQGLQEQLRRLPEGSEAFNEVAKAIAETERAMASLQRTVAGAEFENGSIGQLEQQLQEAQEQLNKLAVGTPAFTKQKQLVDNLTRSLNLANTSLRDQQQILRDLGTSLTGVAAGAAGLFGSMTQGSEAAAEALLVLEQAQQAIALAEQLNASIRQFADAQAVVGMQARTAATAENTAATAANTAATGAGAAATNVAATAIGGLTKVLRTLWVTLVANPIAWVVGTVVALGLALQAASKRFQPIADAFDKIEQIFGGVAGAFKAIGDNVDKVGAILKGFSNLIFGLVVIPARTGAAALKALFSGANVGDAVKSELQAINVEIATAIKAAGQLGGAIADGVKKGVERTAKLQQLDRREQLLKLTETADAIREAELGSARRTEDARRAIRLKGQAEAAAIAAERLAVEFDLTEEELAILKSGNAAKLAEIQKFVDRNGVIQAGVLERFKAVEESRTALLQTQEEARLAVIQDRIKAIEAEATLQQARLAAVDAFANRARAAETALAADLATLQQQRLAGEFKTEQEFETQRQTLLANAANARAALAREQAAFVRETEEAARQGVIANLEADLETRRRLGRLALEAELQTIATIQAARRQGVEAELQATQALAATGNDEARKRAIELQNELAQIEREGQARRLQAAEDAIERQAATRTRALELERQALALQEKLNAVSGAARTAELERQARVLGRQAEYSTTARQDASTLQATLELQTRQYQAQREALAAQAQARKAGLELEAQAIAIEQDALAARLEAGAIGAAQFEAEMQAAQARLDALSAEGLEIDVQLRIQTEGLNAQELEARGKTVADGLKRGFERAGRGITGVLQDAVQRFAAKELGEEAGKVYAEEFTKQAAALGSQLLELQNTLAEAAAQRFEAQAEAFGAQADAAQERIDALTQAAEDSAATILSLEQEAAAARGANAEALQAQLNAEADRRAGLQQQIRAQERERQRFEQQRLAAEAKAAEARRRQAILTKALGIGEAIINTAIGVTTVIRDTPKADFGIAAAALIALYTALGAAQVATIAAQPITAETGGVLTPTGGIVKAGRGGVVRGPSHAAGGVRGTGAFAGIEVEGGEAIIPRQAVQQHPETVAALLQSGRLRPPGSMAQGGLLGPVPDLLAATSARLQALPTPSLPAPAPGAGAETADRLARLEELMAAIAERPVRVAVTDIAAAQARVQVIDSGAAL